MDQETTYSFNFRGIIRNTISSFIVDMIDARASDEDLKEVIDMSRDILDAMRPKED